MAFEYISSQGPLAHNVQLFFQGPPCHATYHLYNTTVFQPHLRFNIITQTYIVIKCSIIWSIKSALKGQTCNVTCNEPYKYRHPKTMLSVEDLFEQLFLAFWQGDNIGNITICSNILTSFTVVSCNESLVTTWQSYNIVPRLIDKFVARL